MLSNMTMVFAGRGNDQGNPQVYTHVAIAVNMEGEEGWYLSEKPVVKATGGVYKVWVSGYYDWDKDQWVEGHYEEKLRYNNTYIELSSKQNSSKNGYEYQSGMGYQFTEDTVFTVTAKFTNGKETKTEIFTISNIENYRGAGKSFYSYCRTHYCDGKNGIDMKLSYSELVENFYDVVYNVDGDKTLITDGREYAEGATVTVTSEKPEKNGYRFDGWTYGDKLYKAGDTLTMGTTNVEFTAKFTKLYNVIYQVNGTEVSKEQVASGESTQLMNGYTDNHKLIPEGKKFVCWMIGDKEATEADLQNITSDITLTAKLTDKVFTVTYYVDGVMEHKDENITYGTNYTVADKYVKEGYNVTDWTVAAGTSIEVKRDIVLNATSEIRKFTVTYFIDDQVYSTIADIPYGADYTVAADYEEEGYDFSGWSTEAGTVINVKDNIEIRGTKTIKTYTVKYLDKDGNEITSLTRTVNYGTKLNAADEIGLDDVVTGNELNDGKDANVLKYSFKEWASQGEYKLDDLEAVKQDMVFKATYNTWNVPVNYYVLNRGLAQPSEIYPYAKENYSKGIAGTLDSFTEVKEENSVSSYLGTKIPTEEDFNEAYNLGIDTEKEYIKWYVIKEEGDGWHVHGIIVSKPTLTVRYVDTNNNELVASVTTTVEPNQTGTVTAIVIDDYTAVAGQDLSYAAGATGETIVTIMYEADEKETTTEEITTEEEPTEEPTTEEVTTEEEITEEPTTEEVTTEEETTEEPTTEEVTTEEETTEEPTTEEAATEEETTEEPTTEEAATEEEPTEEPTTEEATTEEEPTTEAPTVEIEDEDIPLNGSSDDEEPTTETAAKEDGMVIIEDEDIPLNGNVKTGDSANAMPAMAALLLAACGAMAAAFGKKKAK